MSTFGSVPAMTAGQGGGMSGWETAGWAATVFSTVSSAVSAYYMVEAQKYQLKQQALSLDHQAFMSRLNAQRAESDAQAILEGGQTEKAALTLRQGQERGGLVAGQAASGLAAGGSNAEVRASQRLIQRIESMTLDSNTVRQANAMRTRGVNAQNEALLADTSARNLRGSAGSMSPWLGAFGSMAGSAGQISAAWAWREGRR